MSVRQFTRKFKKNKELFLLTLPGILFLCLFSYYPMYGLILPFKDFKYNLGLFKSPWVGFENFKFLFNSNSAWRITRNTVGLNTIFIVVLIVVSLGIALMLNEISRKSVKTYQTVLFFPYFLSWVVVSYVFLAILDMDHGLANQILKIFNVKEILWYNEPKYWPAITTIANTWKSAGYYAIIYYTALIGLDREYFEAASLDGASKWQQIRYISIPLISPLITLLLLLQLGQIFKGNFDLFYNLTRDSSILYPTTDVIDTFVYRALRSLGDIGMASAAGVYQSVVGFVIVMGSNAVIRKINPDNAIF